MSGSRDVEVAIVGGGPAGAALAIRLARAGHQTVLFERLRRPRWRAAGVYSSPLTRRRLAALGFADEELEPLIRPISAMVVETADGTAHCRLEYPPSDHGCGVDRVALEEALLDCARHAGAEVHQRATVRQVRLGTRSSQLLVSEAEGAASWTARLVVGADGPNSLVARAAGVSAGTRRFRRAALTGHRADDSAAPEGEPMEARMIIGDGWYLGVAPVPGRRVNLGLVLGEGALRRGLVDGKGPQAIIDRLLASISGDARRWHAAPPTDRLEAHVPLLHRVRHAAGPGFLLVGDAAGFIDPLSGEGLHRALVSVELGADAVADWATGRRSALSDYDGRLRARYRSKDVVSLVLQLFLFHPAVVRYALRRLARRPTERRRLARRLADIGPASDLIDPRYLARVVAP